MPGAADAFFISPLGLLSTYVWTFASLAAVQLTVRLIMRFDLRETAVAALWLAVVAAAVGQAYVLLTQGAIDAAVLDQLRRQGDGLGEHAAFLYVVQQRLVWLPATLVPLALASAGIARRVLRMRPRAALVSAAALSVLLAPWPALTLP